MIATRRIKSGNRFIKIAAYPSSHGINTTLAHTRPRMAPKMNKKISAAMPSAPGSQSKCFKAVYLRLLLGEPLQPADWWAARELIDTGHAHGQYLIGKGSENHGQVTAMVGFSPTLSGRLLADDLAEQIRRQGWRHRLVQIVFGLTSFGSGWLMGMTAEISAAYALKFLGL